VPVRLLSALVTSDNLVHRGGAQRRLPLRV